MKKYIVNILFFVALSLSLHAQTANRQMGDYEEDKANAFYEAGNYAEAAESYEKLLPASKESAQVYYNLGNAYYKSGQTARAILNYERALLLQPNFDDAEFNLNLAKAKTIDKIENIGELFLVIWLRGFANIMSSDTWAVFSIILFIISLLLAFAYVFLKNQTLRKVGFYGAMVGLLLMVLSFSMSYMQKSKLENRNFAIVMSPVATATSMPTAQGMKLFVLHEGVKVKIKNTLDTWVEIQLSDGQVGWIKISDIEKI